MKIKLFIIAAFTPLFFSIFAIDNDFEKSCASFTSPKKLSIITDSVCTFAVEACNAITSVNFKIRYTTEDGHLKTIPIGMISRRPFKILYSINSIPNQLTQGVTAFAECIYENGNSTTITLDGLFFTHHELPLLSAKILKKKNFDSESKDNIFKLRSNKTSDYGKVDFIWNNDSIKIRIAVNSPIFYSQAKKNIISRCGITVCFDPENSKTPQITDKISIFKFSLTGAAAKLNIISKYDSLGRYRLNESYKEIAFPVSIKKQDFKGYAFSITIPTNAISSKLSNSMGCNIIATVFGEKGELIDLSWRTGNENLIYSPFAYGTLKLLRYKIDYISPILFLLFFTIGGIFAVLYCHLQNNFSSRTSMQRFESLEQDKIILDKIKSIIEREITTINFSIENIAAQLSLSTKKVETLIKKSQGTTFHKHIVNRRLEIVKERLRSSNSSEISIAKACGFNTVEEMEKTFKTSYKTTPYKYREKYRIS